MSSRTQITIGEDGGFETIDFEQANYSMGISPNYYKVCGRDIGEKDINDPEHVTINYFNCSYLKS